MRKNKMSKKSKAKKKIDRAKMKASKKSANYLRCGPKAGHVGKRQMKKVKRHMVVSAVESDPFGPDTPGSKTRTKRRRTSAIKSTRLPKRPLRPLRKRRHLGCPSREERGLS